ncbi:hypothetical protein BSL78_29200 [Apostichopus japonicus]|uniref:Reverse transcriptase domain-containing protein n=1 Tax=Stichopus japonicus TaxID=307972 RepID=A0A2G8JE22_STIJA|nr:hypothetical protein BSL78_29200 [Apostichopus japonicus]
MMKAFHEDVQCAVVEDGKKSNWFDIKTGVKQGCSMSGFLFLTVMDWVMRKATLNGKKGIRWKFTKKLDDTDFADDIALMSSNKQQMQIKNKLLADEASRVGLDINKQKTKVMRINTGNQEHIYIGQEELTRGGQIWIHGLDNSDKRWWRNGRHCQQNWESQAGVHLHVYRRFWCPKASVEEPKIRLCKTLVLPVLQCGCKTWKMNKGDEKNGGSFDSLSIE